MTSYESKVGLIFGALGSLLSFLFLATAIFTWPPLIRLIMLGATALACAAIGLFLNQGESKRAKWLGIAALVIVIAGAAVFAMKINGYSFS